MDQQATYFYLSCFPSSLCSLGFTKLVLFEPDITTRLLLFSQGGSISPPYSQSAPQYNHIILKIIIHVNSEFFRHHFEDGKSEHHLFGLTHLVASHTFVWLVTWRALQNRHASRIGVL